MTDSDERIKKHVITLICVSGALFVPLISIMASELIGHNKSVNSNDSVIAASILGAISLWFLPVKSNIIKLIIGLVYIAVTIIAGTYFSYYFVCKIYGQCI